MKDYEKVLDKMCFVISSTLMDNDFSRKGIAGNKPTTESEILRLNRRTYVELQALMMRLENALYGNKSYEEDDTEISNRIVSPDENTNDGTSPSFFDRIGNFSC